MKREIVAIITTLALGAALSVPALSQSQQTQQQTTTTTTTTTDTDPNADMDDNAAMGPNNQYGDPICGVWVNGVWQPNGHCPGYAVGPHRARVAGTITIVRGHLVTVQLADRTLVINDQPALNRQTSGRVAVGRQIIAYGYWRDGNFYATAME
ncbi:MAG TPA: hypothetical protein VF741_09840 [Candidatus Aquilonibacter sp.]